MATQLDGPRIEPRSGGAARHLVVFVHGYGADGNDLIGLGREWATSCPSPLSSPRMRHSPAAGGRWGGSGSRSPMRDHDEFWRGVATARPGLDQFLDAELARPICRRKRLALVGFSQGTMMALHVGPQRQTRRSPSSAIRACW